MGVESTAARDLWDHALLKHLLNVKAFARKFGNKPSQSGQVVYSAMLAACSMDGPGFEP